MKIRIGRMVEERVGAKTGWLSISRIVHDVQLSLYEVKGERKRINYNGDLQHADVKHL